MLKFRSIVLSRNGTLTYGVMTDEFRVKQDVFDTFSRYWEAFKNFDEKTAEAMMSFRLYVFTDGAVAPMNHSLST